MQASFLSVVLMPIVLEGFLLSSLGPLGVVDDLDLTHQRSVITDVVITDVGISLVPLGVVDDLDLSGNDLG